MRLVKQTTLHFQDAKSDKIYEVDLCESAANLYLVNFRYGRRGKALKEGTKTSQPVPLAQAESIFAKLVSEKTKKGYAPIGSAAPGAVVPPTPIDTSISTETPEPVAPFEFQFDENRKVAILKSLTEIINRTSSTPGAIIRSILPPTDKKSGSIWSTFKEILQPSVPGSSRPSGGTPPQTPSAKKSIYRKSSSGRSIERLVWRVGELRLVAALPLLLQINPPKDNKHLIYSLVWAIGRIGDPSAIGKLEAIRKMVSTNDPVYPLIKEAQMALMDDQQSEELANYIIEVLPDSIQRCLDDATALEQLLLEKTPGGKAARACVGSLYLIEKYHPQVRIALSNYVWILPFTGDGYFKSFRQLFKAVEFREDAELFGLMAYRLQKASGNFVTSSWGHKYINNKYVRVADELKKPDSRIAFSVQTKNYFLRRIARLLRKKGDANDPAYIKLATGILLGYSDTDELPLDSQTFYKYVRNESGRWDSIQTTLHYTTTSPYTIFNEILYGNSPRYMPSKGRQKWLFRENVKATDVIPTTREEAYPELWDRMPQGFLQLLAQSESRLVHEFAIKVARANHRKVLGLINSAFVILLLEKPYEETVRYGLELARFVYRPATPDFSLITALLACKLPAAQQLGMAWVNENSTLFLNDENFVVPQFFNRSESVHKWLNTALEKHSYSSEKSLTIIAHSMAKMLAYPANANGEDRESILLASKLISNHFKKDLRQTSFKLINQLLHHPVSEVSVLGARILLDHQTPAEKLPEELLLGLINGDIPELREVGIQLLGKLPEAKLKEKQTLLIGLCLSPYSEVRKNTFAIVQRLSGSDEGFAKHMVTSLAPWLMKKEEHEGRDEDLLQLLMVDLKAHLHHIDQGLTLDLLYNARKPAHTLGAFLLENYIDGNELTIRQIVQLGSNELVNVRHWVWGYYNKNVARIKAELPEAVRLLDARWDDSRDFCMDYLRTQLNEVDWTPDVLVSICDSVHPVVQQFGQERITKYFSESHGQQYLLQLSQHPNSKLQYFATNYLEQFAADQPENIEALERYFTTVLSGVNKAGVAKKRIFEFLHREGLKSVETARIISRVIGRQSATMAITDKARCLEIMRDLQQKYPEVELPLVTNDFGMYPVSQPQKT